MSLGATSTRNAIQFFVGAGSGALSAGPPVIVYCVTSPGGALPDPLGRLTMTLVTVSVPDAGCVVALVTVTSHVPLASTVHCDGGTAGVAPLHVYVMIVPA